MSQTTETRHTISLRVANKPGVLIRIALVFSRRGYNIESLVVSPSKDQRYSNMNIVAGGDEQGLDQILKQLNKLVDVLHATDRTGEDIIRHETALFKLQSDVQSRGELLQLAHALRCDIIEVGKQHIILEATGESKQLDNILTVLRSYPIVEMIRTGKILMARGPEETP